MHEHNMKQSIEANQQQQTATIRPVPSENCKKYSHCPIIQEDEDAHLQAGAS